MRQFVNRLSFLGVTSIRYLRNQIRGSRAVGAGNFQLPLARVINLPERTDRREDVSESLERLGIRFELVPGTKDDHGALGCALSHRNLLGSVTNELVWVCEDDVAFDVERNQIEDVVSEFLTHPGIDVLCLAHKTKGPVMPVSKNLALTVSTATTASYLVKPHAVQALHQCFDQSAIMLALGYPAYQSAIDVQWKRLQQRELVFAVPRSPIAYQAPSFSDVEHTDVDYYVRGENREVT